MIIYSHPACAAHEVAPGHPERPDRLHYLLEHLRHSALMQDLTGSSNPSEPRPATSQDVLRAHTPHHLKFVQDMAPAETDIIPLDPDTWMGPHSLQAALLAAGALTGAVDDVTAGRDNRVFCAVRPPGHHAEADAAMGFCLFNSVAIGALKALQHPDIERVAIMDFDVHHGNGTVDIFRDRLEVLVCSSFQHPHYPNRMFDLQRDNIVNTPLAAGTDGTTFRSAIDRDWWPALERHRPDLIFVSAGFDAHKLDPLASINLLEEDFAWVTRGIVAHANALCQGRVISTLEGGYDLQALADSATAHLSALAE